jgi:hypothetical protein
MKISASYKHASAHKREGKNNKEEKVVKRRCMIRTPVNLLPIPPEETTVHYISYNMGRGALSAVGSVFVYVIVILSVFGGITKYILPEKESKSVDTALTSRFGVLLDPGATVTSPSP